jgi:drug/metabolite transporter (DMT)-like permease
LTSDSLAERASLRADRVPLGILFMLGATVMFAVSSALSKWQVAEYSFVEVLFFRAIASLLTCAILILPRTGLAVLRTNRLRDHFGRSATQATAQSLIIVAFGLMPLAGAVAINFSSPLFATLFAALWLNEKVSLARISTLMAGFVGVLLVAAPGADSFRVGAMFALANAVLFGSVTAAVRGMTTTESAETLTMYQMIFLTVFFALPLPFFFAWPSTSDAAAMIGNGVICGGTILVDARFIACATFRRRSVLLFHACLVRCAWICFLGRCADLHIGCRLGDRGRLRSVPALARNKQEASPCRLGDVNR